MKTWKYRFTLCLTLWASICSAAIYCPPDMELFCYDDLTDIDKCGFPTLLGNHYNFTPLYQDDRQVTNCNVGTVFRTWYVDINGNSSLDANDPQCTQTLILLDAEANINPSFPADLTIGCLEDAEVLPPSWTSGPCDQMTYTVDSEEFLFSDGACRKIVQHYTVLNWCDYAPQDPNWDGSGIWTHTRLVKVMDSDAPMLSACPAVSFEVGADCMADVVLTQSATDGDDCPAGILTWQVSIDLWADGTEDYFYGPNEPLPFRLLPTASGESIEISLPEKVQIGNHKVTYKVNDGCSNNASCSTTFTTVDNKPPTPYCINFLATAFQAEQMPAMVPVSIFDKGSFDNCTDTKDLRFSFSSNLADTLAVVDCGMQGPNFFNIYVTDNSGNQDFCEVFMFILDNGSCDGSFAPQGRISSLDGSLAAMPQLIMMDSEEMVSEAVASDDGSFQFESLPLMETYTVHPTEVHGEPSKVDLADLVLLQRHILGLEALSGHSLLAADMDADGVIRIADLHTIKDHIVGGSSAAVSQVFVPMYMDEANMDASYDPTISYMDYQNGFDYYSFTRGNISDLQSTIASKIVLNHTYVEGILTVHATEDLSVDGLYFNMPEILGQVLFDSEAVSIFPQGKIYKAGQPILSIRTDEVQTAEVLNYLTANLQLVPSRSNRVAQLELSSMVTATEENVEEASRLVPNPSSGHFFVVGRNVQNIRIRSIDGQEVFFTAESTRDGARVTLDAKTGTYVVTYVDVNGTQVQKLLIAN